jgi:DNA-binding beta-propeller fold protein YncE
MTKKQTLFLFLGALCALCGKSSSVAAEPTYWQDIRPILRKHCTVCHNERNIKDPDLSGGLALDAFESILKGGKTKVVKPGDSADSLLVNILRHAKKERRMPKDADPLPDDTVGLLKRWIDAGAKEGTKIEVIESTGTGPVARRKFLDVVLPTKVTKPPKLELALPVGPLPPVAAVAYSPDGKLLAIGAYGRVTLWDTSEAKPIRAITHVLGAVNDLKFSPDGTTLAVAGGQPSARGDLRLFEVKTGKLLANLGGHADVVACVAFTADGRTLASASFDKTVRLWDMATHQVKQTLTGHSDFVYSVAFSPKGDWIVTASKDRTVRVADTKTGQSRLTLSGMEQDVLAVAVSPDGAQVVSSGYEPSLHWWDPQTGQQKKRQGGHDIAVHELAFDKAGKLVASAGGDKTVRLWNGASGEPIRSLPAGSMVYAVAVRPDGQQVAAGCFDGFVRIWDSGNARQLIALAQLPASSDTIEWLAQTPEGYVSGSDAALAKGQWRSGGKPVAAEALWPALRKPEQVAKALRGEKIAEPTLPLSRK